MTWSTQNNQPTAELYQVHVDDRFPYWIYAGQQDNSTIMVPSRTPEESSLTGPSSYWKAIGGCETGPAVPKPGDPNIVYSNCKGRFGRYNHLTGQEKQYYVGAINIYGHNPADLPYRFQRVVPIEVSPHDPNTVYHGSQFVHRTRDEGVTWEQISPDLTAFRPERQVISGRPITRDITGEEHYSTLYVIEESPVASGVIWTGSNDGPVYVTRDGGDSWANVTPPDMPPEGRIQNIDPSPHDPAKAYVAGYRYLLDDFRPYIYRTEDYGRTWTLLTDGSNGIPGDYPTRVVREDPNRPGLLYAGTEFGMFVSFDDGGHWQSFQFDLPVTPITDIQIHEQDMVVGTMGRSFWILDDLSPLYELDEVVASSSVHLFEPRVVYRLRGGGRGFGGGEADPSAPEYPQTGAIINYYIGPDVRGRVTIEVYDSDGNRVRGFTSAEGGYEYEEFQNMRFTSQSRLANADVEWIVEQPLVVRAYVEADWQTVARMNPRRGRVERELPDRNPHPTRTLIPKAQDAFAVGHDDQADRAVVRVCEHLIDSAHVSRSDPDPAAPAKDLTERRVCLADGRRVNDGHELFDVIEQ